jgi:hypothetical protein
MEGRIFFNKDYTSWQETCKAANNYESKMVASGIEVTVQHKVDTAFGACIWVGPKTEKPKPNLPQNVIYIMYEQHYDNLDNFITAADNIITDLEKDYDVKSTRKDYELIIKGVLKEAIK